MLQGFDFSSFASADSFLGGFEKKNNYTGETLQFATDDKEKCHIKCFVLKRCKTENTDNDNDRATPNAPAHQEENCWNEEFSTFSPIINQITFSHIYG